MKRPGGDPGAGGGDPRAHQRGEMSLLDHLEELRRVLIFCLLVVALAAVAAWQVSDRALHLLARGAEPLHFASLTEAFAVRIKMAIALGFLVALPLVLHRVWRFSAPALFPSEKRLVLPLVAASAVLFYLGMAFAFFGVKPMVVSFFLRFAVPGQLEPVIMVGDYFGFVVRLCLAFGLVFQLPLVVCLLSLAGVVDPVMLGRQWRYAVVVAFVAGGILTPGPDVVSQVTMSVPLLVLYLASVGVSRLVLRRRARRRAAAAG